MNQNQSQTDVYWPSPCLSNRTQKGKGGQGVYTHMYACVYVCMCMYIIYYKSNYECTYNVNTSLDIKILLHAK